MRQTPDPRWPSNLSVGQLAAIACVVEATARKPGNVHRLADFQDMVYADFLLSAIAVAPVLDRAAAHGLGATVVSAVRATRLLVRSNTNLGLILALTPIAAAWSRPEASLRERVSTLLEQTSVEDARAVYRAIREAAPGGMRQVSEQDLADEPTISLRGVMALAADRDLLARQYVNGFEEVFTIAQPELLESLGRGHGLESAVIRAAVVLLARRGDSLIGRRRGESESLHASRLAGDVLNSWSARDPRGHEESLQRLAALDQWLRAEGNARNPGTTADLVAAALFAGLLDETIPLSALGGPTAWSGLAETSSWTIDP